MKTHIFKRGVSVFMAMLMCLSIFVGIGTTTASAAGEQAEAILVFFPRDGDVNYYGEWGHDWPSFMNGWSTKTVRHNIVYAMGDYNGSSDSTQA